MAGLLKIVPRIGPFRTLRFQTPTPEVEKLFMASFNKTLDRYRELLSAVGSDQLKLPNENLDLGEEPVAGKYRLSDQAYAKLLDKLAERWSKQVRVVRTLEVLEHIGTAEARQVLAGLAQGAPAARLTEEA